jgi:hypothetical protein
MNELEQNNQNASAKITYDTLLAAGLFYRCGWCGQPTDKDGNPLDIEICKLITEEQLNSAELVHGYCCLAEQEEKRYITVTRDMAIDAGDLSLEGERWRW